MKTNRTFAFTLVELLVVIGIVGVLAALLLSAVRGIKARANRIGCASQLKQWNLAMQMYTSDNEGVLPREDAMDDVNSWVVVKDPANQDVWYNCVAKAGGMKSAADYAANPLNGDFYSAGSMFRCPGAKYPEYPAAYPVFSLVINSQLAAAGERVLISDIQVPPSTVMFLDCGVPGEKKGNPLQREFNGQPKGYANRFSARHSGGGNLAMADGAVHYYPIKEVVEPTNGRSIFPPRGIIWSTNPSKQP